MTTYVNCSNSIKAYVDEIWLPPGQKTITINGMYGAGLLAGINQPYRTGVLNPGSWAWTQRDNYVVNPNWVTWRGHVLTEFLASVSWPYMQYIASYNGMVVYPISISCPEEQAVPFVFNPHGEVYLTSYGTHIRYGAIANSYVVLNSAANDMSMWEAQVGNWYSWAAGTYIYYLAA